MTRRRRSQVEINMFPFLSVLCAVIGILMLFMIVIIATRAQGRERPAWTPPADPTPSSAESPGLPEEDYEKYLREIGELRARLAERRRRCDELKDQYTRLAEYVRKRRDEDELGPVGSGGRRLGWELGRPTPVEAVLDGVPEGDPIPVVIDAEGFTVHPAGDIHPEMTTYRPQELQQETSPIRQWLQRVDQASDDKYLLLLVKPNGIANYEELHRFLLRNYPSREAPGVLSRIGVGVEPFSKDWLLISQQTDDQ